MSVLMRRHALMLSLESASEYAYTTLNPNDKSSSLTLSNGNLTATRAGGSAWSTVRSTIGKSRGKWYIEVTNDANGSTDGDAMWGFMKNDDSLSTYPGNSALGATSMGWEANVTPDSAKFQNGSLGAVSGYGRVAPGQWAGFAIDFDAGKLWVGNSSGSGYAGGGDPAAGTSPTFTFTPNTHLHFAVAGYSGPQAATVNFGASAFSGTVPTGFSAGLFAPTVPGTLTADSSFSASTTNDAQGVAANGTHVWFSSSSTIYKYTAAGSLVTSRDVMGDNPTSKTQINGMFLKDGVLYVSAAENSTPRKSWIVEYNPDTLAYITHHAITGDWFSEGVAWKDGYWWVVFHASMTLAKVDPSTWAVAATFPLTFLVTGSSGGYGSGTGYDGIAWRGDYLYCNIHEIYDQDYLDIYYFDGTDLQEVARLARPSATATQGMCVDPTDDTAFWFAQRSTTDSVAKVTFTPT